MIKMLCSLCLVLLVVPSATAAEVYRWIDERGQVHYGDQPPGPRAAEIELHVQEPSAAEQERAAARVGRIKAQAQDWERERIADDRRDAERAPPAPEPRGELSCEERHALYRESDACFAPFRNVNGSIKPEAFEHCVPMQKPDPCD